MTKARLFFWIMWANIVAFFVEAFSGFVLWLVLPYSPKPIVPAPVFIFARRPWIEIHKWDAILITVMVVIHVALHWTWIVKMVKSLFRIRDSKAGSPAPVRGYVPLSPRNGIPAYQTLAVKAAEGLGYLNTRQQGYIRLENSTDLAAANRQRSSIGLMERDQENPGRANPAGQVKIVTCKNCLGQIGWRMELGIEGSCPYCGAMLRLGD